MNCVYPATFKTFTKAFFMFGNQIMDPDSCCVLIALEILNDIFLMLFSLICSQWVDRALLFFSSCQQLTQAFFPLLGYTVYAVHKTQGIMK